MQALPDADRCIAAGDPAHWERVVQAAALHRAHFALGIHPWFDADPALLDTLDAHQPDALGEIGLDALRPHANQATTARLQLERAQGRVVVLHCVRAHAELLALLKQTGVRLGLVHAWTGSPELAERFVEHGLHLSFGPALLGSPKIQEAARRTPTERLLIETDGQNTAGLQRLPAVLQALADARGESVDQVRDTTATNAHRLFPRPL